MTDTTPPEGSTGKDKFEELLAPVVWLPSREEPSMAGVGQERLEAVLSDLETVAGGALAQRFAKTSGGQLGAVRDALAHIPTEDDIKRLAFIGELVCSTATVLDGLLPPGRHKSLTMTALEDVMNRARLALLCDDRDTID